MMAAVGFDDRDVGGGEVGRLFLATSLLRGTAYRERVYTYIARHTHVHWHI